VARLVVKSNQLVGTESERRVRLTRVVAELNLVHAWPKALDDSADLPPQQPSFRDIFEQSYYREHLDFSHRYRKPHLNNTKQLVSRGNSSPRRMIHALRSAASRSFRANLKSTMYRSPNSSASPLIALDSRAA